VNTADQSEQICHFSVITNKTGCHRKQLANYSICDR